MPETGTRLAALCAGRPVGRPLRAAVRDSLERIGLLLRLCAAQPPDRPRAVLDDAPRNG